MSHSIFILFVIGTTIVDCDDIIVVKSGKLIEDDGTIRYCSGVPAEVSSTGHHSEANNMCILTCTVQSDLFSPFLEINGTLRTVQEINSSASFSVHHHSKDYSLVFSCMPLLYRCCTSEDVCSDTLHLKEDAGVCESERTPLPSESPTSHYPTVHPVFPTSRNTSNESTAEPREEDTGWKVGLAIGVPVGLLSVVIIAVIAIALGLFIAKVIHKYSSCEFRSSHTMPQSVPENNGGEGKSQFACGLNVPFKRSNSERSIKEGIEESCSSHQPLNAP